MAKGAIHIHSTYSDGEFNLGELRNVYLSHDCRFVCVTDHAEYFDAGRLSDYVAECEELSDERFVLVPGLEFTCDQRMHILGFGAPVLAGTTEPQRVIRHIRASGGIAVIAHPMDSAFSWIESFEELPDGIETWNSKYDGHHAPRPQTFELLNRLQRRSPRMRAYYGQDLHWKHQNRGLLIDLEKDGYRAGGVLDSLRRGEYRAIKGRLEMSSTGELPAALRRAFGAVNRRDATRRRILKKAKKWIDQRGIRVPGSLKAQLRRIF